MESKKLDNKILLNLSAEEALVFAHWLFSFNQIEVNNYIQDQSEQRILWDLESILEKVVPEITEGNYHEQLEKARKEIRD